MVCVSSQTGRSNGSLAGANAEIEHNRLHCNYNRSLQSVSRLQQRQILRHGRQRNVTAQALHIDRRSHLERAWKTQQARISLTLHCYAATGQNALCCKVYEWYGNSVACKAGSINWTTSCICLGTCTLWPCDLDDHQGPVFLIMIYYCFQKLYSWILSISQREESPLLDTKVLYTLLIPLSVQLMNFIWLSCTLLSFYPINVSPSKGSIWSWKELPHYQIHRESWRTIMQKMIDRHISTGSGRCSQPAHESIQCAWCQGDQQSYPTRDHHWSFRIFYRGSGTVY